MYQNKQTFQIEKYLKEGNYSKACKVLSNVISTLEAQVNQNSGRAVLLKLAKSKIKVFEDFGVISKCLSVDIICHEIDAILAGIISEEKQKTSTISEDYTILQKNTPQTDENARSLDDRQRSIDQLLD